MKTNNRTQEDVFNLLPALSKSEMTNISGGQLDLTTHSVAHTVENGVTYVWDVISTFVWTGYGYILIDCHASCTGSFNGVQC